ncbi:MAG: hypothetical protein ACLVJO_11320 [[Clostridium] scindens]
MLGTPAKMIYDIMDDLKRVEERQVKASFASPQTMETKTKAALKGRMPHPDGKDTHPVVGRTARHHRQY